MKTLQTAPKCLPVLRPSNTQRQKIINFWRMFHFTKEERGNKSCSVSYLLKYICQIFAGDSQNIFLKSLQIKRCPNETWNASNILVSTASSVLSHQPISSLLLLVVVLSFWCLLWGEELLTLSCWRLPIMRRQTTQTSSSSFAFQ